MPPGERQIEMLWRCSSCGAKNLGRHMTCPACGSPKEEHEEYEMPANTAAAPTVEDPALLRLATAGANWRCAYCGSDQRRLDGACAQCGAGMPAPRPAASPPPAAGVRRAHAPRRSRAWLLLLAVPVVALATCGAVAAVLVARRPAPAPPPPPFPVVAPEPEYRDVVAEVAGVTWEHVVVVERWAVRDGEGFAEAKPDGAFDVRPAGQRAHHTERVPHGFATETYAETVPDGFATETYTEREACGQACKPRPQTCTEKCTSNKNGFATCKTVCTGGGQDCSTRWCDRTKTRQVPRTRTVQRTRQVPKFRDETRMAPWFAWKAWGWAPARTVRASGTTVETGWPDGGEIGLGRGLAAGEKEREARRASYGVDLRGPDGAVYRLSPGSPEEIARFAPGSQHAIRVWQGGRIEVVDPVPAADAEGGPGGP